LLGSTNPWLVTVLTREAGNNVSFIYDTSCVSKSLSDNTCQLKRIDQNNKTATLVLKIYYLF